MDREPGQRVLLPSDGENQRTVVLVGASLLSDTNHKFLTQVRNFAGHPGVLDEGVHHAKQ